MELGGDAVVVSTKTCRALVYIPIIRAHDSICRIYIRRAESGGWVCRFTDSHGFSRAQSVVDVCISLTLTITIAAKLALLLLLRRQRRIAGIRFY